MIKNICLILTGLLLLWSNSLATDYTQDANCQGAWLFTEGSGTTVADSSQNSNTGNFKGDGEPAWASMAGTNAPSYADYMVDFDGSNDYILAGTDNSLELLDHDLTIVSWCMTSQTSEAGIFAKKSEVSSPYDGYKLILDGANNRSRQYIRWDSSYTSSAYGTATINDGEWHHIASVIDRDGNIQLYADGIADGSAVDISGYSAVNLDSDVNACFGRDSDYTAHHLNGNLSETGVFDRTLDSTEINEIMDNGLVGAVAGATPQIITNIF